MNSFEDELRQALRREEPPVDFAQRLVARASSLPPKRSDWLERIFHGFRAPVAGWIAVAVASLLVAVGMQQYRAREVRAQGEQAKERLVTALRITSDTLRDVQQKVQKTNWVEPLVNYADISGKKKNVQ